MTTMPVLETARLHIRPPEMDDLEAIHQLYIDASWAEGDQAEERQKRHEWLEWAVRNHRALAHMYQPPYGERVVTLPNGTFVGMVGVVPSLAPFGLLPAFRARMNENADPNQSITEVGLFWAALNKHRGQGYMTEAARCVINYLFTTFNLNRVVAQTDYDNLASIAVMRRLGMTIDRNPQADPPWLQVVGLLENTLSKINPQNRIETSEGLQQ